MVYAKRMKIKTPNYQHLYSLHFEAGGPMKKAHVVKRQKKVRGAAYELISIMAIVSCMAIERCFTPHAKERSTILDIYKDENFLREMKDAFTHDKDLSILAKNFSTFIRVVERIARGK